MQIFKFIEVLLLVVLQSITNTKADETYDAIVLGTGIKECILSGMLSKAGKKVLHIDKNKHYGGEFQSFNPLNKLFSHFNASFSEQEYGKEQSWNVDLIPKFIQTNGKFSKLLIHIGLTQYFALTSVEGSYVFKDGKITKVSSKEDYRSLAFPLFGLGEMFQACSKISEVSLGKPVDEVTSNENGVIVKSGSETFKGKQVYCDPSYVPNLVKKAGKVIRAICLLNHPIGGTRDSSSSQLVIPHEETGRKNDIHISLVSSPHQVASNGWFIGTVSSTTETDNPEEEIKKGIGLLVPIAKKFVTVHDYYEPLDDGTSTKIFISKSADATTNFETIAEEVVQLYNRGTSEDFDLSKIKTGMEEDSEW